MSTTDRPQLKPGEFRAVCSRDHRARRYENTHLGTWVKDTEPLTEPCQGAVFTDRTEFERHMIDVHNAKPLPKALSTKPYPWKAPKRAPFVASKHAPHTYASPGDLLDWHGRIKPTELVVGDRFTLWPGGKAAHVVEDSRPGELLISLESNGKRQEGWFTLERIAEMVAAKGRCGDGRVELMQA